MNLANLSLRRRVCTACAFAIAVTMNPARLNAIGAMLYATQFQFPATFYSINTATGAATAIGNTGSFDAGLAFRKSNGVLYGSDGDLDTINVKTGHATNLGSLPDLMVGLAFSPTDQLYAVNNSNPKSLYQLDPVTRAALSSVQITGTVFSGGSPFSGEGNGIAFGPDGTLFFAGFGLYTLNPLTGVASRITPLGMAISGNPSNGLLFEDIDFGADGVLRGVTYANGGPTSYLYTINPSTGLGTLVGPTGFSMDGLASIPTPEPSSVALLVVGTLSALVFCRRYRNRADKSTACSSSRRHERNEFRSTATC
jgi:hypothetical protein